MNRSKVPLVLMEQLVMLLVFALAAAVCLRIFVFADLASRQVQDRDRAAELVQNAAQVLQHTGGDFSRSAELLDAQHREQNSLMIDYDGEWALATDTMRYTLGASRVSGIPYLGMAEVWCRDEVEDLELFRLKVAWQEVDQRGA